MTLLLVVGLFLMLFAPYRTENADIALFFRVCHWVATVQVLMTIILLLGIYTPIVQQIICITPLVMAGYAWFSSEHIHYITPTRYHIPMLLLGLGYLLYASPSPWMRDELTYHLALAKQYAQQGSFVETDFVVFSYFPQGWQSFLTLLHDTHTGTFLFNPRYFSVLIVMVTACGLFGWLKDKTSLLWAMTGSILYLCTPSIFEFGTSCYVQPWLTAVFLWLLLEFESDTHPFRIGLIVGIACSLKYSALIVPLFLLLMIYYQDRRLHSVSTFLGGTLLTGSVFYIRNIIDTGNPLFPMMYSIFAGEGWDEWQAIAYEQTLDNYGMGRTLLDYLLLPFRLFTTQDMTGYFQGSLGFGWLLMLIIGIWQRKPSKDTHWMWFLLGGWFLFWAFQVQQVRFFLPILPLMTMLLIPILYRWRPKSWLIWVMASMVWTILPLQDRLYNQQGQVFWKTFAQTQNYEVAQNAFLAHRLPESIPPYKFLNDIETKKIWLVWMRGYHYYIDKEVRIDNVFGAYRFEKLLLEHSLDSIHSQLQQDDISHVVINRRFFLINDNADYLGKNATKAIQKQFNHMIQKGILHPVQRWGSVELYEVDTSSESAE